MFILLPSYFIVPLMVWAWGEPVSQVGRPVTPENAPVVFNIPMQYPFVSSENVLVNDSVLLPFYERMYQQRITNQERISIVHMGDSHIQADMMTEIVRSNIQTDFGNAGRGLLVPYKVAGTNEPFNYVSSSSMPWRAHRIVQSGNREIGVGGLTITTTQSGASIRFKTLDKNGQDYAFDQAILFYDRRPAHFLLVIKDDHQQSIDTLSSDEQEGIADIATLYLPTSTHQIEIVGQKQHEGQTHLQLYGISVEKSEPGVLYHAIGINGATYRNYANAPVLSAHLQALSPDLIIFSLGTNEAQSPKLTHEGYMAQIDSAVSLIRLHNPYARILLTTPADSYRNQAVNPTLQVVHDAIVQYALTHGYAYWDLYQLAGGSGSAAQWRSNGLLGKDGVHFTQTGYIYQGHLLYQALVAGFNRYIATHKK